MVIRENISSNNCILKYRDYKDDLYLYDSKSNCIFKHSNIVEDILTRYIDGEYSFVTETLSEKYPAVNIDKQMKAYSKLLFNKKDKENLNCVAFDSLWLNISHECNLRCVYCYGGDGTYGTRKPLMTIDDAKKTIDYWYQRLDKSAKEVTITFFGGEPTVNKKVIAFSIGYLNDLLYRKLPVKYKITTNGTIMDAELLKLLKNNNFIITVSIDGDEENHNKNRPFSNGEGSFRKAIDTILLLQKNDIYNITARLTIVHENVGNLENNVRMLWGIGIKSIALNMVASLDDKYKITNDDIKCLRDQIHNLALKMYKHPNMSIYNLKLYGYLLYNRMNNNCLFYSNKNLLVETNGDVYRCHRLVGNRKFVIGNIFENSDFLKENHTAQVNSEKCSNCWANKLCTSCPQINYLYNNNLDVPYDVYCDFNKILIEEGIKLYTTARTQKKE